MPRDIVPLDPKKYEQDEDGLPREIVGPWALEKYLRVQRYVGISGRAVRRNWYKRGKAGATYIELFCGPGRVRIEESNDIRHGSALAAWIASTAADSAFTQVHIADADERLVTACSTRLQRAGAPVWSDTGPAIETVDRVIAKLNRYALHFAFLDPYNLKALPFAIIQKLAALERMDILIHVSVQDLNRNLRRYIKRENSPLDTFAPGWRVGLDTARPDRYIRWKLYEHWRSLIRSEGMDTAEVAELVSGTKMQPLYWLAFAARHKLALQFWEKIREPEPDLQNCLIYPAI
ncbi:MAG: three-Cys-motif partner protein TcmP [Burkholderiales bacterium]